MILIKKCEFDKEGNDITWEYKLSINIVILELSEEKINRILDILFDRRTNKGEK
jgi:hypothetical protein